MRFTTPGTDCVFCACRHTAPATMTGLEVAQAMILPFAVYKCPHCLQRFWRLDVQKLILFTGMVLITAAILYMLLKREDEKPLKAVSFDTTVLTAIVRPPFAIVTILCTHVQNPGDFAGAVFQP
jgi:hypothetical protein